MRFHLYTCLALSVIGIVGYADFAKASGIGTAFTKAYSFRMHFLLLYIETVFRFILNTVKMIRRIEI